MTGQGQIRYEHKMEKQISITPPAAVHLIGICGTGMGSLAGLLASRGFRVTGSDAAAYPPMSTALRQLGIPIFEGYSPAHLDHRPDLVVVGNVCRPDHPEAAAARERGLPCASMARTLSDLFLVDKNSIVISGTHGKTTTSTLVAFLLHAASKDPSFLIGGVTGNFDSNFRLGNGNEFVVEGDEYDSAYFEKIPKFLLYRPRAAVVTSIEYDHIDIYPSPEAYHTAFREFGKTLPDGAPLAVYCGDGPASKMAEETGARVWRYGVAGDPKEEDADWLAIPREEGGFDLQAEGHLVDRFQTPLLGRHNLRNTLAAFIMCHQVAGVDFETLKSALPSFKGVKRRQEVVGTPRGITVYDDFAHHPTAVFETLRALRQKHPRGQLIAAIEHGSATACRRVHQQEYGRAFDAADRVVIAPPGRTLPTNELIDTEQMAQDIANRGGDAFAADSIEAVLDKLVEWARPGDAVVLLSNGSFGGLSKKLLEALA